MKKIYLYKILLKIHEQNKIKKITNNERKKNFYRSIFTIYFINFLKIFI